jgi:serine/threonine-protein kinase
MTDERWKRVADLYQAAEDRSFFVRQAAAGDSDLRREVESLLAEDDQSVPLDNLIAAVAQALLADNAAVQPGSFIGPYRIDSLLGVGGMGEVYRAHDPKLNRNVAIKILPSAFATDPDRLARFKREAQVLASLNHPNIAGIHGFEDSGGVHALVLELVDGPTLADRLARGPIEIDEALAIARQIADALEAAHEQGIIHRDLKPANIKVRDDGTVKVLDFGLAKLADPMGAGVPGGASMTQSPTITTPAMTAAGMILGTAAYMAPEQARGRTVDKRADIWAFGVVVYEMLTGRRAFEGEDVSITLAAVMMKDPDWQALPPSVPGNLRLLLRRCIEREPKRRLRDIGEARVQIEDLLNGAHEPSSMPTPLPASAPWRVLPWTIAGAAIVALTLALAMWAPWRSAQLKAPVRLEAGLGADVSLVTGNVGTSAVLSPDGRTLVFAGQQNGMARLYARRLDQLQASPLSGTDGAASPFFSPDGQWVAFFAEGKLKKIAMTGGAAVTLCSIPALRGGWWADDGTITLTTSSDPGGYVMRVSAAGGTPERLTNPGENEITQRWSQMLPGGKAVLFMGSNTTGGTYDDANIVVQALPAGPRKIVVRGGHYPRYVPSGHLLYLHEDTLFAIPFDVNRLDVAGQPVPVLEGVSSAGGGGGQFAASADGTLVYRSGLSAGSASPISWMDRDGNLAVLRARAADWSNPQFSPDGRRLAMDIDDGTQTEIWVYDWERGTLSRLTSGPGSKGNPVWTPDGSRIVFRWNQAGSWSLFWQRADGTGEVQRLTEPRASFPVAGSWHPSGKFLLFTEVDAQTNRDILILPMDGNETSGWKPGQPTVFLKTSADEQSPVFSPDGRWIAYHSNETGRNEIYVRPFPGPGGKWQISNAGGRYPMWSHADRVLLFDSFDQHVMVASYAVVGDAFRADGPRPWSTKPYLARPRQRSIDLHPDGVRLAVAPVLEQPTVQPDRLVFIFNFFDELRRIAPATKR